MIALSSLVLAGAVSFGGGTMDDLAKSLATESGKNAVIVTAFNVPKMPAFTYDASSSDNLSYSIDKNAHIWMAPGTNPIFSDRFYCGDHFREIAPRLPDAPTVAKSLPDDFLKNGKVTLQTSGALPIAISTLATAKWSHPMRVDYMLRDLAVSASVQNMAERDFLNAVAQAAGAFVTVDDTGYHMAYDGEQLRTHIVNTLKQEPPGEPTQVIDVKRAFYIAVVNILPMDVLSPIFLAAGLEPRLNVLPNSDLAEASIEYIKAIEALPSRPQGGTPDGGPPIVRGRANRGAQTDILSHVDNRAIVHLRLNCSGEIILSVPVIQGRQSSYIEL